VKPDSLARGFLILIVLLVMLLPRMRIPLRGVVGSSGLFAGFRHSWYGCSKFGRILRPGQPDLLAAGATHGTAPGAQSGQFDGVRCCTVRANDVHGAIPHNDAAQMLQADR